MDNSPPPPPPPPPPHQQPQQDSRKEERPPQSSLSSSSEPASQNPSIATRIQNSASGLLQNTFSGPSSRSVANDIASTLATGLALSGKGSSPSSVPTPLQASSSTSGNLHQPHGLSLGQPSSRAGGGQRFPSESFRSTLPSATSNLHDIDYSNWEQLQDHTQNDVANYNNTTLLLDPYDLSNAKGKGKLRAEEVDLPDPTTTPSTLPKNFPDNFDSAWYNSSNQNTTHTQNHNQYNDSHQPSPASYTPHPADGQAVISLLTSPTFQPATFTTPPESPQSELFELDASMLPPPSSSTPSFPPNQLSLIPDINSILSAIQQQQHPQQHDQDWDWTAMPGVAEWLEVDGMYQDTVWGFLKPYVEAARKEVVERRENGEDGVDGVVEDGPAVKRLGMVLGHLKARL